jgi:hypothetical protein
MSIPPIVTECAGPTPYKLTNVNTNVNVFFSDFYPNQLSDLAIWLDGSDINGNGSNPADGTPLNAWINKAPNLIDVKQTNPSFQPVYNSSRNSVIFTNTNSKTTKNGFDTTYSSGQNETVFILLSNTTTASNYNLLYPTITNGRQLYLLSNSDVQTTLTTAKRPELNLLESGVVAVETNTLVSSWSSNVDGCNVSLSVNHYINGFLTGTFINSVQYATGGNTLIGTDNYVGDNGFNGSISEIIIYSNVLSDSDRQKVESYLRWKWGTFTLDPLNPYETQAYSNYIYPNINSNIIPPVPRNLFSGLPTLDSNNYPLIKNFIQLPNRLRNVMF